LAYERIYKIRPSKLILESITDGRSVHFVPTDLTHQQTESHIRDSVEQIKRGQYHTVSSGKICSKCNYQDLCPASKTLKSLKFKFQ